ncbi:MAG: GntR family transcriptional regulator [Lachnospiraceae bacterium]|nr:GntR family transcriptional regulator [Lachnospiraceae bacterium]
MSYLDAKADEYLPLRDVAFRKLRQAILRGELQPGQRLMEIALAEQLGVSRTPVREAIRMLEQDGLAVMIPRRGAVVSKISGKNLRDVLEVRRALEELAVDLACTRMTDEDFQKLKEANERFSATLSGNDITKMAEADEAFHDLIYQASDNARLVQLEMQLREQMYRFRIEHLKEKSKRYRLVEDHNAIIRNLINRDSDNAREAIREHINAQEVVVMKMIEAL